MCLDRISVGESRLRRSTGVLGPEILDRKVIGSARVYFYRVH